MITNELPIVWSGVRVVYDNGKSNRKNQVRLIWLSNTHKGLIIIELFNIALIFCLVLIVEYNKHLLIKMQWISVPIVRSGSRMQVFLIEWYNTHEPSTFLMNDTFLTTFKKIIGNYDIR